MNRATAFALTLGLALLSGCSKPAPESSQSTPADPVAPLTPMVLASHYAVANLAYRIAGDDLKVVYPVPRETDPAEWRPAPEATEAMRSAALILSAGPERPSWIKRLESGGTTVVDVSSDSNPLVGFDPLKAMTLTARIAEELSVAVPAGQREILAGRADELKAQIAVLDERWTAVGRAMADVPVFIKGEVLAPWTKRYGIDAMSVENTYEIKTALETRKRAHMLFAEPPGNYLEERLAELGIAPLVLDPARVRPAEGDFLDLAERNLSLFAAFTAGDTPADTVAAVHPGSGSFEEGIVPLIEKYCVECHDAETNEGEIDFEIFFTEAEAIKKLTLWEDVAALLEMRDMPPRKEKKQPTDTEREQIIAWVDNLVDQWTSATFGNDPGKTTIRRINKNEYNYTIRDLFGLRLRPADQFPEESGGEAGFDNTADALFLPALLMENYVEASGNIVMAIYADRTLRGRYLFARPSTELPPEKAARKILEYWASRAYRRPVIKEELDRLVTIYRNEINKKKKSFDEAMKMPLVGILISPNFLYRAEFEKKQAKPYRVEGHDLANRLSYFLWSSMPDEELIAVAKDGSLLEPDVLEAQVRRMLADEKARSLSMHFAGQWFGWEKLRTDANPDEVKYPEFSFELRVDLYRESAAFFGHLIESNGSVLDLLDSDYAFINDRLARHYGIRGVTGRELRKVALTDPNRGGVLGMGSVLTATSMPLRSSPAARGDYVLSEILGTPTPEPPMDVAMLPDDDREIETKTFREALEQHRLDPNCKACHEAIDPIGFGMENFDAIGRWRTKQNGNPLDTAGVLPDGRAFSKPSELKKILLEDKELFARNMSRKVLTYALGRELTPFDLPTIQQISERLIADDYRIHTAFLEVAKSYPFLYRRNENYEPTAVKR